MSKLLESESPAPEFSPIDMPATQSSDSPPEQTPQPESPTSLTTENLENPPQDVGSPQSAVKTSPRLVSSTPDQESQSANSESSAKEASAVGVIENANEVHVPDEGDEGDQKSLQVIIIPTEETAQNELAEKEQSAADLTFPKDPTGNDTGEVQTAEQMLVDQEDGSIVTVQPVAEQVETINEQAEESPKPDTEEVAKPIQRTFTTPDGQPVLVIEQVDEPPREIIESAGPDPGDEQVTIVEQPVEIVKEAVITEKAPSEDELVEIIDQPLQVTNDAILVKTQSPDDEIPVIEQEVEIAEEKISPENQVPLIEEPVQRPTETPAMIEDPAVEFTAIAEEPKPVEPVEDPAGESVVAIEEPVDEHVELTEEPAVEQLTATEQSEFEPLPKESPDESLPATEEPATEPVTAMEKLLIEPVSEESAAEPISPIEEPVVENVNSVDEPEVDVFKSSKENTVEPVIVVEKSAVEPITEELATEPLTTIEEPVVENANINAEPAIEAANNTAESALEPLTTAEEPVVEPFTAIEEPAVETITASEEPTVETVDATDELPAELPTALNDSTADPVEVVDERVTESAIGDDSPTVGSVGAAEESATEPIMLVDEAVADPITVNDKLMAEPVTVIEQVIEPTEEVSLVESEPPHEQDTVIEKGATPSVEEEESAGEVNAPLVQEVGSEIDGKVDSDVAEEVTHDDEPIEDIQSPLSSQPNPPGDVPSVEIIAAEAAVPSPGPGIPAIQPKAASICAIPTTQQSTAVPRRWSSHYDIKSPTATLKPLDVPAATFAQYIAETETQLLLHRYIFPTDSGETHQITDEYGEVVFNVITETSAKTRDQATKTLFYSHSKTPILLIRPRVSAFGRLLGTHWHIEALTDLPRYPPRAILKRRAGYWPFRGHRPALTARFIRHDTGAMQEVHSREDLSSVGGGILRLGDAENGPVVAVVQTVVSHGTLPPAAAALRGRTYGVRVGKGFDQALACAILVALDERRWWWGNQRRKVKFQERVEVGTS